MAVKSTTGRNEKPEKTRKSRKKTKKKDRKKEEQEVKKEKTPKWKPSKFIKSSLIPLVVFGDGMKNKDSVRMKKRLAGVTEMLYKQLILRQKQHLTAVVDIDEFRTSVTCNICKSSNKMLPMKLSNGKIVNSILESKNPCNILWQRDINAAKNMFDISNSIWQGKGRPDPFTRQIAVAETTSITFID